MNKQSMTYGYPPKRSIKNIKITFTVLLLFILQLTTSNIYAQDKKVSYR